ncbi:hypothetical protein HW555_002110 [Spodoptera exigua]|uniref:Ataxin-10 n=1 Tax=Spodoptera exigua TaxID=7107 RepID=A0A835GPA5_SPOEX|nr:hypothetical protein HW555_002110 [Spodoptera exigua]
MVEEILLDAKLINFQLETGEWDAVEEMLRAEAQLSRDAETGRLRPKKASEYTLRLIAEVLHIMRLDVEQASYNRSTLAVAEQCLRLVRSCAAAGTKMQTYISKELSILDSMLILATEYQHPSVDFVNEELQKKFESCMTVLMQTLGNLVVNNPFNQIMIWNKFDANIMNSLVGSNDKIATAAAMIVYNILLGQPNVLPDDVMLLNSLAYMYSNGNTEYPHLIIEYLIGVENTYIEKLYSKLDPECRMLVLNLAYNILMSTESQDINVSVNFVKFMAHEFKSKSDCILKTVDKYVNSIEPQEVVFLLEIIATASSMDTYMDCLQSDILLRAIHKLGKESSNFFSSLNKLYEATGRTFIDDENEHLSNLQVSSPCENPLTKNDSADNMLSCNETTSECTESESSEQYFECNENPSYMEKFDAVDNIQSMKFTDGFPETKNGRSNSNSNIKIDADLSKVAYKRSSSVPKADDRISLPMRRISLEHKIDIGDDNEPPLIMDAASPNGSMNTIAEMIPAALQGPRFDSFQPTSRTESQDSSPNDPPTEIHISKEELKSEVKASPSEISPPLAETLPDSDSQKQSPDTPKEVKKSQNLSTDFDLSEQLQKILGISSEKTRGDTANAEKKSEPAKEVKIADDAPTNKVPSVKIDSPEGAKTRLGAIDMTTPKKAITCVETVERHVAFGFKAALVRTLANLCWKNQENKKLIRELEVIPVLLDCCNIDALIMQWVIFAVRNLCENCPENQEVISKVTLQAPVDNEVLQEMGLTLHTDTQGNNIRIVPMSRG